MIDIRQIDDSEFMDLISLNKEYHKCLPNGLNTFQGVSVLVNDLIRPGALATGLFRNNVLIGYTIGYAKSKEVFHFTSLYVMPEYRYYTVRLYRESERAIKDLGYVGWIADKVNEAGKIHKRMGANIIGVSSTSTIYYKEI